MDKGYDRSLRPVGIAVAALLVGGCGPLSWVEGGAVDEPASEAPVAVTPAVAGDAAAVDTAVSAALADNHAEPRQSAPAVAASRIDSDGFIPVQRYDAQGSKVPYRPRPNPYLAQASPVPASALTRFRQASRLLVDDRLDEAEQLLQALTEEYPALAGPWLRLGVLAQQRGQQQQAVSFYRKAIELNPDNINVYPHLALAYRKKGQFAQSEQTYLEVLSRWPDFPEAHFNLGVLYDLYLNDAAAAQQHFEAYYFLTGSNNEQVRKWLVDLKRRSGVSESFVDRPPAASDLVGMASAPPEQ